MALLWSFVDMHRPEENLSCPHTHSQLRSNQEDNLCFSAHTVSKCPFCGLFSAKFFTLLCFCLVFSLFEMAPKHSLEVLPSVPKCEKAVMCLAEKMHMLEKLCSDMSYSAVGCEFNLNESTTYIK